MSKKSIARAETATDKKRGFYSYIPSREEKHPSFGSEIPHLKKKQFYVPDDDELQENPKPKRSKHKAPATLRRSKKQRMTGPFSSDECLEVLDEVFHEINGRESRMYQLNPAEIIQAGNCTNLSKQLHPAEFTRTLTYGEVEPEAVADTLIPFLDLADSDVFYDLGCGTGKIVMHVALQTKCKGAKGIEIMHDRAEEGNKALLNLQRSYGEKLWRNRITIAQGDISAPPQCADLKDATVLFVNNVCFGPALMQIVMDILKLHPGIRRVVTLRKICERHRDQRCALKGYTCNLFVHPPSETRVLVSWAHNTSDRKSVV